MQETISSDSERSRRDSRVETSINNGAAVTDNNEEAVAPTTPTATRESSVKISPGNDNNDDSNTDGSSFSTPQRDLAFSSWSEVLKTPSADDLFSPARDIQKPSSLHGVALQLTAARSQKLSRCGQKCAILLFDISNYHNTFATELEKSCHNLIQSGSAMNQAPVAGLAHATHKSLVSFAKQMQGLAICIKGSVARPWKGYMTTIGELAPNIYQGYASARAKASQARQAALMARAKCVNSMQEAESVIQEFLEFKKARGEDPKSSPDSLSGETINIWESELKEFGMKHSAVALTDRVVSRVKEVHSLEAKYKELVDMENQAVEYAQTMEVMALEALSKLEEERLQNFIETVSRTLQAEKGALDKMILSLQEDKIDSSLLSPDKKKKQQQQQQQDFFASLLIQRPSGQYEEGMGVMDADTLGLPQEVGKLRDEVRSRLETRSSRMQAMRTLASFLEEVASAAAGVSTSILNRLAQDGYPLKGTSNATKQTGYLARDILANEGPNALQIWNDLMESFEQEAEFLGTLAKTLRSTRHEKLDVFLVRADRELKAASEHDDNMWKHLCEAARTETKAEQRYRQTAALTVKARDRVKSVDSDSATGEQGTVSGNFKQSMSKALGNMFSVLPDGGDQAMQIFAPDARRAVAQSNLEEADQKEAKSRQYLQAATLSKSKALASYKAKAEGLVASYAKDDQTGWSDVRVALESGVVEFEKLRTTRYESLTKQFSALQQDGSEHLKNDMKVWTERVKLLVDAKVDQAKQNSTELGSEVPMEAIAEKPALPVVIEKPKVLEEFLSSLRLDDSEVRLLVSTNQNQDEASPSSKQGGTTDNRDNASIAPKVTAVEIPEPRNLARSFTAPVAGDVAEIEQIPRTLSSLDDGDIAADDQNTRMDRVSSFGSMPRSTNPESDVFLAHFWSDRVGNEPPPTVIESFSCAYWPKDGEGYLSPLLHGRLFATAEAMYFVGWGGKKIELKWKDVATVEKAKNLMGTIDNALRVTFETSDGKGAYFFGSFSFRENAFTLMDRLSTVAKSLKEIEEPPKEAVSVQALQPVPPDEVLKRMEVVLSSTIESISIKRFYEIVWSEGIKTGARPFYKPWLRLAAHNVQVGDWEFAEDGAPAFVNKWCGESYGQKRVIRFKFQRKTHLYIGPPVADVIQTHHCRVEGNDKVVVAMTVEFEGIPYADTFAVEVRWVARREGLNDVKVDVGLFVDFRKSTFLKKQISAGTIAETKPVHQSLFEAAKRACAAAAEGVTEEVEEEKKEDLEEVEIEPPVLIEKQTVFDKTLFDKETLCGLGVVVVAFLVMRWLVSIFSRWSSTRQLAMDDVGRLHERINDLEVELNVIREAMEQVLAILRKRDEE